jgi:hypothetical protein
LRHKRAVGAQLQREQSDRLDLQEERAPKNRPCPLHPIPREQTFPRILVDLLHGKKMQGVLQLKSR